MWYLFTFLGRIFLFHFYTLCSSSTNKLLDSLRSKPSFQLMPLWPDNIEACFCYAEAYFHKHCVTDSRAQLLAVVKALPRNFNRYARPIKFTGDVSEHYETEKSLRWKVPPVVFVFVFSSKLRKLGNENISSYRNALTLTSASKTCVRNPVFTRLYTRWQQEMVHENGLSLIFLWRKFTHV